MMWYCESDISVGDFLKNALEVLLPTEFRGQIVFKYSDAVIQRVSSHYYFRILEYIQHIRIIFEGSRDTKDYSNAAEN